jgi:hypothetical protein
LLSGIGLLRWALPSARGGASDFWQGFKEGAHGGASISSAKGLCFDTPFKLTGGAHPGAGTVTEPALRCERTYTGEKAPG